MKVTQNPIANTSTLETSKTDKTRAKGVEINKQAPKISPELGTAVHISDQAHMMKQAREIAHATPDMRADRVSDLKRRIQEGAYKVDSSAIADKLVDEHLATSFGKNNL